MIFPLVRQPLHPGVLSERSHERRGQRVGPCTAVERLDGVDLPVTSTIEYYESLTCHRKKQSTIVFSRNSGIQNCTQN